MRCGLVPAVLISLVLSAIALADPPFSRTNLTYSDATPVIETLRRVSPAQVRGVPDSADAWSSWVIARDAQIRSRLVRGDEDSLLNVLLFGTSFTTRPRAVNDSSSLGGPQKAGEVVRGRIDDLSMAILEPGANERLQFARTVVARSGVDLAAPDAAARTALYLRSIMTRVVSEVEGYRSTIASTRTLDPVDAFVERSTLLQMRGLSSDTSILPSYAVDETLRALRDTHLAQRSVHRVAIVGPGLDFTDKAEGFDFYAPQTLQPFAVIDGLRRWNLAAADLGVETLDLNPRVNQHLQRARARAATPTGYALQLVRPSRHGWRPGLSMYWQHFGDQIGDAVKPIDPPPIAGPVDVRAVRLAADVVSSVAPYDLDIVLQHLEPSPMYDLVVATNVFVYYGSFEQALAVVNVAKMLRPGGILLSNNALPERVVPAMKSIGSTSAVYSNRPDDRDLIVWYQRQEER